MDDMAMHVMSLFSAILMLIVLIIISSWIMPENPDVDKTTLSGNEFVISEYDNYSNKTLQLTGSKVTVGLLENSANFNTEDKCFK